MHWVWIGWTYLDDNWMNVFPPSVRQTAYCIKEECGQQIEGSYYPSSTQSWRGSTWDTVLGPPRGILKHRSKYKRSVAYNTWPPGRLDRAGLVWFCEEQVKARS